MHKGDANQHFRNDTVPTIHHMYLQRSAKATERVERKGYEGGRQVQYQLQRPFKPPKAGESQEKVGAAPLQQSMLEKNGISNWKRTGHLRSAPRTLSARE